MTRPTHFSSIVELTGQNRIADIFRSNQMFRHTGEWTLESLLSASNGAILLHCLEVGLEAPEAVAAGRVLAGGSPTWPEQPAEAAFLQLWPGRRRLAGLRLQAAVLSGAALPQCTGLALQSPAPSTASNEAVLARDLSWCWQRFFGRGWALNLARDVARHWSRYMAWDVAPDRAWDSFGDRIRTQVQSRARHWARQFAVSPAPNWAQIWALEAAPTLARDWAKAAGLDPEDRASIDFASIELLAFGRAGARARLSRLQRPAMRPPLAWLLASACRLSFDQGGDPTEFQQELAGYDGTEPLWPALARYLARQGDAADEELLIAAARDPYGEGRHGYLAAGLQFIVRGDVRLDAWYLRKFPDDAVLRGLVDGRLDADGAVVLTLDEIADAYGIAADLPYLGVMEDELEVDWGAE